MSKFSEASETIKRLQVMFKGLLDLSEAMDSIDSLENHVGELELKKTSLLGTIDDLWGTIEQLKVDKDIAGLEYDNKIRALKDVQIAYEAEFNKALDQHDKALTDKEVESYKKLQKMAAEYDEKFKAADSILKNMDVELSEKTKKLKDVTEALEKIKGGI